jgi:YD repeat-containing protein
LQPIPDQFISCGTYIIRTTITRELGQGTGYLLSFVNDGIFSSGPVKHFFSFSEAEAELLPGFISYENQIASELTDQGISFYFLEKDPIRDCTIDIVSLANKCHKWYVNGNLGGIYTVYGRIISDYGLLITTTTTSYTLACDATSLEAGASCIQKNAGCIDGNQQGNPCNIGTGNKYQSETDYVGAGVYPLQAIRFYNSRSPAIASWGSNWRGYYDRSIDGYIKNGTEGIAILTRPEGKQLTYRFGGSSWSGDGDVTNRLSSTIDASSGALVKWTYVNDADEVETYDANGKLQSIANRAGAKQLLTYSCTQNTCATATPPTVARVNGLLIAVVDPAGRSLNFFYDENHRIARMTDPAGNDYKYQYSDTSSFANLESTTYPGGSKRGYLYGEPDHVSSPPAAGVSYDHYLTGLVDENGDRFATWNYDEQGRAVSSEHGDGLEKVTLAYTSDNAVMVADALGTVRTYSLKTLQGVVRNSGFTRSADNASIAITYDANGNEASRTNFNGSVTNYKYDLTRNLEIQRTEAAGSPQERTTSTQWHDTYFLPTSIAQPNRITRFTYDASGNLLAMKMQATSDKSGAQGDSAATVGTPRVWNYSYNNVGQLLTAADPLNNITTFAYDGSGNLVSTTNPAGHATVRSNYDANGRVKTISDPNGLVITLDYSPRGWITSEKVGNEVTLYSYDNAGELTQVTMPDGSTLSYGYDVGHRLISITNSVGENIKFSLDAMGNRIGEQVQDANGTLTRQITRVYDALNRLQSITGKK